MTDEPMESENDEAPPPAPPEIVDCRHCGEPHELAPGEDADWLCSKCEHYQDQTVCPTCGQVARLSLMPQGDN